MIFSSLRDIVEKIKENTLFSWLNKEKDKIKGIVISPDTDGFICGLFLNNVFGWKVIGFYDGKKLIITKDINLKEEKENIVFIDIEILRQNIKSIGHHVLVWNIKQVPPLIKSIRNSCLQPNLWRGIDAMQTFKKKYPFGTFHLLISIIYFLDPNNSALKFNLKKALTPTLYIDGTFKNLFNYPENCLDWLKYLSNNDPEHPFEKLLNNPTTTKELISSLKNFFDNLDSIWFEENIKGKILLENRIITNDALREDIRNKLENYLKYLSGLYDWNYSNSLWPVFTEKVETFEFKKEILRATKSNYSEVINKNPISLAITSMARKGLEFTIDIYNVFNQQSR